MAWGAMRGLLGVMAVIAAYGVSQADGAELAFTTVDAPPWAGSTGDGQLAGAFADIVAELERRTGHHITITLHPLVRALRELENGEQDCAVLLWNDSRGHVVQRGEQIYAMAFGVIARRGVVLDTFDDLLPLAISVTRNLKFDPQFDGDNRLRKDFDKDYKAGLRKLERGRVDAIAGALPTIVAEAEGDAIGALLGDQLRLSVIPLVLQCSRQSPNLGHMASLDQAIRDMRADGDLARLLACHGYP